MLMQRNTSEKKEEEIEERKKVSLGPEIIESEN